ncbi:MAG: glycyl-radical enzyme activating protein [Ruminococcaceae bacterium]|nr:glycyl-radical enzyme activating protein [Oscillospiraceae bacterium]
MEGYIFDIKHFAVHDGPGIRTTVFFKGCPLKCVWCHNPESIGHKKQLGYLVHKCVGCGKCAAVCPTGAHTLDAEHGHHFDRQKCIACGECTAVCRAKALSLYGRGADSDTILEELLSDADFYECSNGGVTLSGGECLMQADFCAELLAKLKAHGIHTAVDTCGFVPQAAFDKVMPYTDLFLYDVKAFDEETHIRCTGRPNAVILENLRYLTRSGKDAEIRIPCVPGMNLDEIEKIGRFLSELDHITGVRLLPYHNYAATKYKSLDMENTLPEILPTDEEMARAKACIASFGLIVLE